MNVRQKQILELLTKNGEVFVQELADQLSVATMTIRRDLDALEHEGSLIRTHGGAVLSNASIVEFAFLKKGEERNAEKRAIANRVAALLEPSMTVALDTGTTCLEVAKALKCISNLTVLTSSLAIASALYACENISLVLLGGKARKGNPDLTGWLTEENLKHFRVDVAVLGADGADRGGAYTTDDAVARVSQGMIAAASTAVLAADFSKFDRTSFLKYAAWPDFDHVITDMNLPHETRQWLQQEARRVTYAEL